MIKTHSLDKVRTHNLVSIKKGISLPCKPVAIIKDVDDE